MKIITTNMYKYCYLLCICWSCSCAIQYGYQTDSVHEMSNLIDQENFRAFYLLRLLEHQGTNDAYDMMLKRFIQDPNYEKEKSPQTKNCAQTAGDVTQCVNSPSDSNSKKEEKANPIDDELRYLLEKRMRVNHPPGQLNHFGEHPTNVFDYIRDWYLITNHLGFHGITAESVQKYITLVTKKDYTMIKYSLIRLQWTYQLNITEIIKGNIDGYDGLPLTEDDVIDITESAFEYEHLFGHLDAAHAWYSCITHNNAPHVMMLKIKLLLGNGQIDKSKKLILKLKKIDKEGKFFLASLKLMSNKIEEIKESIENNKDEVRNKFIGMLNGKDWDDRCSSHENAWHDHLRYTALCRGQKIKHIGGDSSGLKCMYWHHGNPYLRFAVEELNQHPPIYRIFNVVTEKEDVAMKAMAIALNMMPATIASNDTDLRNYVRSSKVAWPEDNKDPLMRKISRRIGMLTQLKVWSIIPYINPHLQEFLQASSEKLQVVNYGIGGEYKPHLDGFTRLATFMIYLNKVERGGATVFTEAGISVEPIANSAVLWYNYLPSGEEDMRTLHAGCPVLVGQKWIANKWIHSDQQTFTCPCQLHPDAEHKPPTFQYIPGFGRTS